MSALLRLAAWMLAIVLVALPIVAVLNGWIGSERWPMRSLVVTGAFEQVADADVREAVLPLVGRGFFAVDLGAVHRAVAVLPWVDSVQVRKRWPDRLEVSLTEHRAVARWGDQRMLAGSGQVFAAPANAEALPLPRFVAPDDRVSEIMAFHEAAQTRFARRGLAIAELQLSPRGSWRMVLADGLQIELGRDDAEARLERFVRLLPQIRDSEPRTLVRADLRYTNGFALSWQDPPAAPTPLKAQASS